MLDLSQRLVGPEHEDNEVGAEEEGDDEDHVEHIVLTAHSATAVHLEQIDVEQVDYPTAEKVKPQKLKNEVGNLEMVSSNLQLAKLHSFSTAGVQCEDDASFARAY